MEAAGIWLSTSGQPGGLAATGCGRRSRMRHRAIRAGRARGMRRQSHRIPDRFGYRRRRQAKPGVLFLLPPPLLRGPFTPRRPARQITFPWVASASMAISTSAMTDGADPAVEMINRLCGHLPLAIGMMARQLHHHPTWSAAGLAHELAAARDRLELMHAENLSVAAAFDLSYQDLTAGQQRLFRRLGLHPGTDIDSYAAAALDGSSVAASRRGLDELFDQHLVTETRERPLAHA